MRNNRIEIIRPIHGKVTADGKISEPDIHWILEKWLERHPETTNRRQDIRVITGQWTTDDGLKTEIRHASIVTGDDVAHYDAAQDADLYEYYLAEDRYFDD